MIKKLFLVAMISLPSASYACLNNLEPWKFGFEVPGAAGVGAIDVGPGMAGVDWMTPQFPGDMDGWILNDGITGSIICTTIQRVSQIRQQFSENEDVELTGFSVDVGHLNGRAVTLNFEFK